MPENRSRSGGGSTPPDRGKARTVAQLHALLGLASGVGPAEGTRVDPKAPPTVQPVPKGRDPFLGSQLGRCVLEERLGQGGMGVVYRARHLGLGVEVAVKILPPWLSTRSDARERFGREARALARLDHPNVLRVHDVDCKDDLDFMVMEYVRGGSAGQRLAEKGPLGVEESIRIVRDAARGLGAAHSAGLIHRDVKPDNLLLTEHGHVKVADFGLARDTQASSLSQTGGVVGTPAFMSPEQALAEKIDHRTDVFSLGATLYALLEGRSPFQRDSWISTVRALAEGSIESFSPSTPQAIRDLVRRMAASDRDRRPADMSAVVATLESIAAGRPSSSPPGPAFLDPTPARQIRRAGDAVYIEPWGNTRERRPPRRSPSRRLGSTSSRRGVSNPRTKSARRWVLAAGLASVFLAGALVLVLWLDGGPASSSSGGAERGLPPRDLRAEAPNEAKAVSGRDQNPPQGARDEAAAPEWIARIEAGLDSTRITFEGEGVPLADFVQVLREQSRISFVLDPAAGEDDPCSLTLRDATLRHALDLLTTTCNLAWKPSLGVIVITTGERLDRFPMDLPPPPRVADRSDQQLTVDHSSFKVNIQIDHDPLQTVITSLRQIFPVGINIHGEVDRVRSARSLRLTMRVEDIELSQVLHLAAALLDLEVRIENGAVLFDLPTSLRQMRRDGAGSSGTPVQDDIQRALDDALDWLARHHDPILGLWDSDDFQAQCGTPTPCSGRGANWCDVGLTGLALLAFLAAGHTPREGDYVYKATARRALHYLSGIQDAEGCIGDRSGNFMYNHVFASLAMVEAFAKTASPSLRDSARKAIEFLLKAQNPGSGWKYFVAPGESDTSVTGWAVMTLKSAEAAGLAVPVEVYAGARAWLDSTTDPQSFRTGYCAPGDGGSRLASQIQDFERVETCTAIGIVSRILMGADRTDPLLRAQGELCSGSLPTWDMTGGTGGTSRIDFYYWYHGSHAMLLLGGEPWLEWRAATTKALLEHQRRDGEEKGSWAPLDAWSSEGGRVYATAMNALALQICLSDENAGERDSRGRR